MSTPSRRAANTATNRMLRIAAVAAAALLLTGCGRFHVDLEVAEDNTLNGEIIVAILVGDGEDAETQAQTAATDLETKLLPGLREASGVMHENYAEDGYLGSRLILLATPMSALEGSQSFTLERDGDVFQFTGTLELAPDNEDAGTDDDVVPDDGESDVVVSLRFPGEVTSHNGEATETTVTWSSDWTGSLDMRATAMAERPGAPMWAWVIGGLIALTLIIAVVATAVTRRKRAEVHASDPTSPAM